MRSGTLVVLVVLLASIACSQKLRFVYPVPAPPEFTQRKQTGQTGLSLDLFTTHTARSKPLPVFVIFNGFGGEFMRTSAQSQAWAKAATAHGFAAVTAETTAEHVAEDFDSLVFYLRQHAEKLHIDPDRLVVYRLVRQCVRRTSDSRGPATQSHQGRSHLLWIGRRVPGPSRSACSFCARRA